MRFLALPTSNSNTRRQVATHCTPTKEVTLKDLIDRLALAANREKEIYRTQDSYGPVVVCDYDGLRILSFDSHFEQSAMRLDNPLELVHDYTQVMLLVLLFKEAKHVTLLGLGGGSLLRVLHKHCPATVFEVVELRESVIQVALNLFSIPSDNRVVIHNRDGIDYVSEAPEESTDLLYADMYQAYAMEEFQSTSKFLEQCCDLLTSDGWLVINFHKLPEFDHPYMEDMCALFPEVLCCGTNSGNYVVMCSKQPLEQSLPDHRNALIELEQRFNVSLRKSFAQIFKLSHPGTSRARSIGAR